MTDRPKYCHVCGREIIDMELDQTCSRNCSMYSHTYDDVPHYCGKCGKPDPSYGETECGKHDVEESDE